MVPGRPHGAEGIVGGAGHDLVHGVDRGAGGSQRRVVTLGGHGGVGIEPDKPLPRDRGADRLHIAGRVDTLDRGKIGTRRLLALQRDKGRRGKGILDGAQAIRPLRMALAHIVEEAIWVGEKQRGH